MPRPPATRDDDFKPRNYPIEDDIAFQRKVWKVERVGWVLLSVLVICTLLGLFSRGPLSARQQASADGALELRYQRFQRQDARSPLHVAVRGEPGASLAVVLEAPFFATYSIEAIHPQPLAAYSERGGLGLVLRADRDGRASVHLTLRPEQLGAVHQHLRFGSRRLTYWQFVYP